MVKEHQPGSHHVGGYSPLDALRPISPHARELPDLAPTVVTRPT
jgi:hypothetical protein